MNAAREPEREAPGLLPEIGPLLGGLVTPTPEHVTPVAGLDQVRLDLVSAILASAGAARARLADGDTAGAEEALGPQVWRSAWDRAVAAAAERVLEEIAARLHQAAQVSRMSPRRLAARLPGDEDRRVLKARLSAAGIALEDAAARLESGSLGGLEGLRRIAGELELAWAALAAAVRTELASWEPRIALVRSWRRGWTGFVIGSALALAASLWLGLVLGGYLPVPDWLYGFAQWAWGTGWL